MCIIWIPFNSYLNHFFSSLLSFSHLKSYDSHDGKFILFALPCYGAYIHSNSLCGYINIRPQNTHWDDWGRANKQAQQKWTHVQSVFLLNIYVYIFFGGILKRGATVRKWYYNCHQPIYGYNRLLKPTIHTVYTYSAVERFKLTIQQRKKNRKKEKK